MLVCDIQEIELQQEKSSISSAAKKQNIVNYLEGSQILRIFSGFSSKILSNTSQHVRQKLRILKTYLSFKKRQIEDPQI